jgi:type IX secretion system PorP/SprF family membrane protein
MKRIIQLIAIFLIFAGKHAFAQDVHLSQFYETPLMRNPALAGIFTGDLRVQVAYRNQWQSTGVPFQTSVLSAEYKFPVGRGNDFLTAGLSSFYDVAGSSKLRTLQLMPAVNFHKSLNAEKNRYLSLGFMGGIVQRSFNAKDLTFDNQYTTRGFDPTAPTGEIFSGLQRSFADMAVGLSYNSSIASGGNFYIGASLWHFNKPTERFINEEITLDFKWQANAGIKLLVNDNVEFTTEANYVRQGQYSELVGGPMFTYLFTEMTDPANNMKRLAVSGGAMVRLNDAVIPVVRLEYNNLNIGFSYDLNTSKLRTASQGRGGYELTLSWKTFTNEDNSAVDDVRCPRF